MIKDTLAEAVRQLPKAELHVHLEGSLEPATVAEIAPEAAVGEVEARYAYRDFRGFLDSYKWLVLLLTDPGHYALAARRLFERLAAENVRYVEVNLSVGVMIWKEQEVAPIFEAVHAAAARAPLEVRWIFDAVRQFGPERAMRVAELAAERTAQGVVGFGMGGDEASVGTAAFRDVFRYARERGLHLAPHAGETTAAASVWEALELGAERIGHGIRAVDDAELLAELRRRDIPLEISLSSNVCTGAAGSLAEHPLRRICDAGVPVVLNTDDPAMFRTTLCREYELAATGCGFSLEELRQLAENGFRYAFDRRGSTRSTTSKS
jgi:adenosine deaminase/aminodeoxyfutalosine deaminase